MPTPIILFVCSGNSARSQMAEAFLRYYAGHHYTVYSAGLAAKGIHPLTRIAMQELGLSLAGHHSKTLSSLLNRIHPDIVITVCDQADKACPIIPGVKTRLHWSFTDPAAHPGPADAQLVAFRQVRDQIHTVILQWLQNQNILLDAPILSPQR